MNDLPPCNPKIFKAPVVLVVDTGSVGGAALFEAWLKEFAAETGTATDWHYAGGRALVRTLNDVNEVADALLVKWESNPPLDTDGEPMTKRQSL